MPKGGGYEAAEALWRTARGSKAITVLPIDSTVEEAALTFFWSMRDKAWSVTTCANILLMQRTGLLRVLSANRHYSQAGLICLCR